MWNTRSHYHFRVIFVSFISDTFFRNGFVIMYSVTLRSSPLFPEENLFWKTLNIQRVKKYLSCITVAFSLHLVNLINVSSSVSTIVVAFFYLSIHFSKCSSVFSVICFCFFFLLFPFPSSKEFICLFLF